MHPSFRKKNVIKLQCRFCDSYVCRRGMKAVLLADTAVELYSTDSPMAGKISNIGKSYSTKKCTCKICDVACTSCGNVLGYHVMLPCSSCLQSCNNGHLWIFNSNTVFAESRLNISATETLRWDSLPDASLEQDSELDEWDNYFQQMECCR
ncbi:protein FAM72A-like [Asterias amurensis]|uniref:protein FAM72A-like n=1 Tax=Asterias amurensis TaxID=7602 RepID=UPI003AB18287